MTTINDIHRIVDCSNVKVCLGFGPNGTFISVINLENGKEEFVTLDNKYKDTYILSTIEYLIRRTK